MPLPETYKNEAMDSPTSRHEAKTPHCKIYNPVMELTAMRESSRSGMHLRYTSSNRPSYTIIFCKTNATYICASESAGV